MNAERIHFIGCLGAGMLPLARIMLEHGAQVSGSDLKTLPAVDDTVVKKLIFFHGHRKSNLPQAPAAIVYSSAVTNDNIELAGALKNPMFKCIRRGEFLALIAPRRFKQVIAVSGSHGKTSITALLDHILRKNNIECGALIGGKLNSRQPSGRFGDGSVLVTEVDESDATHTLMHADIGIVSNVEDDHCWSVGGKDQLFKNFRQFALQSKKLIYCASEVTDELFKDHPAAVRIEADNDFEATNRHLAVTAVMQLGINKDAAFQSAQNFPGVARRMCKRFSSEKLVLVEDYAHHPTEVAAAINSLRRKYPDYQLEIVFQPHRYARLERYFDDFAAVLRTVDKVYITDVFAAWTGRGKYDSQDLVNAIGARAQILGSDWKSCAHKLLESSSSSKRLIAILGAGDIDTLVNECCRLLEA